MIGYKYPTIALGATPIGSAEHAPDRTLKKQEEKEIMKMWCKPLNISTTIKLRLHSR
jgi:hypothetical protein